MGLYRDNGKENGNYYIMIGYILGLLGMVGGLHYKVKRASKQANDPTAMVLFESMAVVVNNLAGFWVDVKEGLN